MREDLYEEIFQCEDHHWWFVGRRSIIKKTLNAFLTERTGDILEIGCGSGGNLALLASFGKLQAIELDERARKYAADRGICQVSPGSLPDNISRKDLFDLICLFDVIEHIDDDKRALQTVWNKLKRQGKLLLTVPAYMFLWSAHDVVNEHRRRYVKKDLHDIVAQSGFRVIYSSYFNTFLFPLIFFLRKLKTRFGKDETSDLRLPARPQNWILRQLFSAERFLIPRLSLPFGVSIILIAEKSDQ